MASNCVLPGQPIPLPRSGPVPQLGGGIYSRDSELRASLVGVPQQDGAVLNPSLSVSRLSSNAEQVLSISRVRPRPPAINSVVLGSVTRLSPLQATISISVVDGVPLPAGEEFTGVIRSQDVRATEKDRVKIGDSFRGGDVVRGVVVSAARVCQCALLTPARYPWATHAVISLRLHETIWEWCLL